MRSRFFFLLVASFLVLPALFGQDSSFSVVLRPGVSADIAYHVVVNPRTTPPALDVVVVHGLAQTARTFEPLAEALFTPSMGNKVGRVILLDEPGHGNSSLPTGGLMFGDLLIEDYATTLLQSLQVLRDRGFHPDVLIGHSLGAEVIQVAQERLMAAGGSLRQNFGVRGAVLIAPVIPEPLPWAFADSGAAAQVLGPFIRFEPALGLIADFPPPVWVFLFYSDRSGQIPAGAPSPGYAASNGYISFEPFIAGLQTVRAAFPPSVRRDLFGPGSGTTASVITLEQDQFFAFPSEHRALYDYLTSDAHEKLFFALTGPSTVHNMHTFNPAALLEPIKKVLNETDRND